MEKKPYGFPVAVLSLLYQVHFYLQNIQASSRDLL